MTKDAGDQTTNRWLRTPRAPADEYDARYEQRALSGENVHGEADFVMRHAPRSVLDAGCGTGRIARELARRGVTVVGVDIDDDMLATARRKAPELKWICADLANVELERTFDLILLAGNVLIFLSPGTEGQVLENMARHLAPGGKIVAGFQLQTGRLSVETYDALATAAGLRLAERWSTWDRNAWDAHGDYVLSVHAADARSDAGQRS
ncbi:MAG: class I SAM-dependent methyltransferase [Chloroflexota bacterium]